MRLRNLKNNYALVWEEISKHKQITLLTHIVPDGDTIGSSLALKYLIQDNLPGTIVKITGDRYPKYLDFLENNDNVDDKFFDESLKIVVDTSNYKRVFDKRVVTKESLKIDHHHDEEEWLLAIGGDHWPATGQVIYEMAKTLDLTISEKAMEAIFVAVWTDTSGLTERNINDITRQIVDEYQNKDEVIAKLDLYQNNKELFDAIKNEFKVYGEGKVGITNMDIDNDIYRPLISWLWQEAKTTYLVFATYNGKSYRVSLRSDSSIDVSTVAARHNGGGHLSSSGAKAQSLEEVMQIAAECQNLIKK